MMSHVTVDLREVRRVRNTRNGNPVWVFDTDLGTLQMRHDAMFGLGLTGNESGTAELTMDDQGRVMGLQLLPSPISTSEKSE